MLCNGEGFSLEQDEAWPKNSDIVEAFSPSNELKLHCVMNTADRELFVMASSCRNAKIIAVYHWHLQGIGCGRCSGKDMKGLTERVPEYFSDKLQAAIESGEPGVLYRAGYVSEEAQRLSKERRERFIAGIRE